MSKDKRIKELKEDLERYRGFYAKCIDVILKQNKEIKELKAQLQRYIFMGV